MILPTPLAIYILLANNNIVCYWWTTNFSIYTAPSNHSGVHPQSFGLALLVSPKHTHKVNDKYCWKFCSGGWGGSNFPYLEGERVLSLTLHTCIASAQSTLIRYFYWTKQSSLVRNFLNNIFSDQISQTLQQNFENAHTMRIRTWN